MTTLPTDFTEGEAGHVEAHVATNTQVNTNTTALDLKQTLDSDLTAIAALTPTNDDIVQRKAGAWTNRTVAQVKTDLTLVKSDVGLGNVDNTSDVNKPVSTATQTALDLKQTLDSDLTAIAALTPTNDDIVQRKAGAWTNRTLSQLKTDLVLTDEDIQDIIGAMVTGNTETGIAVTYDDSGAKLNFVVSGGTDTSGWWGDGSDGVVAMDGTNTFASIATKSGSTYTLIRDMAATLLTVSSGVTIDCAGYRIFCTDAASSNAGTISNNGLNSNNQNGGAVAPGATVGATAGAGGTSTTTTGTAATNQTVSLGSGGGAGGLGSGGAGGAGGTATAPASAIVWRQLPYFISGTSFNSTTGIQVKGGAPGGGGGGNSTQTGGGGGSGGGLVVICSPGFANTGTIQAKGGNGNSPANSNTGGGGGGGGGAIRILTKTTVTGTLDVSGGTGGTGNGTGVTGTNGTTGNVYQFIIN